MTYFLLSPGNLFEEENVDSVHFGKVGFAFLCEKVVHILLRRDFLHQFVDVDLKESWWWLIDHHWGALFDA